MITVHPCKIGYTKVLSEIHYYQGRLGVVKRAYDTKYRKQNLLIAGRGLNRANKNAMLSVEPKMDK